MKKSALLRLINFWPPYLGAGVSVKKIAEDMREIDVEMKAHFWNRNYVGTHFGGSLYAMTDPFYMLILIENLGPDYMVWDKASTIKFKKPGRGRVRAKFEIPLAQIESIRSQADREDRSEPTFFVQIFDDSNEVVAEVEKLVSVKRKDKIAHRNT
jgi:Domain of unknown function (DUF4442)